MKKALMCAASALMLVWPSLAHAQQPTAGNLERLSEFKTTGTPMDIPQIPQTGAKAEAIKKNLARIKLPRGFKIGLYAIVPDARHMAVGPQGVVTFVGTRKSKVWAVTDRDKDRVADEVKEFAPSISFAIPNGVCFSKDGFLFIVEQNRVLVFPAAEFFYEGPDVAAFVVVKQGELIPPEEESYNHTARVCRIGPDDKLYITLGQPFNVFAPEKMDLYKKTGIGGIIRMTRDGKDREVFAWGVRNSVGMDFNPKDRALWFTDNQVDGMGDDQPPGELNRADKPGMNFGFPYFGGGKTRTNEYKDQTPPADVTLPAGRDGRPRRRPRHDVLHRPHVPAEIPRRHLLGPARLVEPHHADRRARDVHEPQGGRHRRQDRGVRRRLAHRERRISRPAGRCRAAAGRIDPGLRRFRRCRLPHLVRGPVNSSTSGRVRRGRGPSRQSG